MLKLYNTLSFNKLHACRFIPTCSNYAIEAIEKRGVFLGSLCAIRRVLRCYPLATGGIDPVE